MADDELFGDWKNKDSSPGPPRHSAPTHEPVGPSAASVFGILGVLVFGLMLVVGLVAYFIADRINQQELRAEREVARREEQRLREIEEAKQRKLVEARRIAKAKADARLLAEKQERERIEAARLAAEEAARQEAIAKAKADAWRQDVRSLGRLPHFIKAMRTSEDPDALVLPNLKGDGLSWRVGLLPQLGFTGLYNEFRHDEPWDSQHNKSLIWRMPLEFGKDSTNGFTRIRSVQQLDGPSDARVRYSDISDGLDQTALFFIAAESDRVVWTRPDATSVDSALLNATKSRFVFVTGTNQVFESNSRSRAVEALLTGNGGEILSQFPPTGRSRAAVLSEFPVLDGKQSVYVSALKEPVVGDLDEPSVFAARTATLAKALAKFHDELKHDDVVRRLAASTLSWRVHLLPYLGYGELYRRFDISKPWNAPGNFALLGEMPDIFRLGGAAARTRFAILSPIDVPPIGNDVPTSTRLLTILIRLSCSTSVRSPFLVRGPSLTGRCPT